MDEEEKQELAFGFGDLERLGDRQREGMEGVYASIAAGETLGNALKKIGHARIDPEDRFRIIASIYYEKFGGDKSFTIQWNTINAKIPLAKTVKFKPPTGFVINPIGYVLGARVYNNRMEIDKSRLDMTFSQFQETLRAEGIQKEDILRYARFWGTLLK